MIDEGEGGPHAPTVKNSSPILLIASELWVSRRGTFSLAPLGWLYGPCLFELLCECVVDTWTDLDRDCSLMFEERIDLIPLPKLWKILDAKDFTVDDRILGVLILYWCDAIVNLVTPSCSDLFSERECRGRVIASRWWTSSTVLWISWSTPP